MDGSMAGLPARENRHDARRGGADAGDMSMRSTAAVLLFVTGMSLSAPVAGGGLGDPDARPPTDANLITAIDDSSSINTVERALEYAGLARAVRDPRFLAEVAGGPNGRVG